MRPPLSHMRIRENSSHNLYGLVRDGGKRFHAGWDLAAAPMTPTYAVADGTVMWVQFFTQPHLKNEVKGTYGRSALLRLDGKYFGRQLFAFYAHLSHLNVNQNDRVVAGQQIGYTGITGYPFENHVPVVPDAQAYPFKNLKPGLDEAHLHFEFRTTGDKHISGTSLTLHVDPSLFWHPHIAKIQKH